MVPTSQSSRAPSLRIAGFPVHVRPGFILFMALIVIINLDQPEFGIWLALFMAGFTLLHELGHAVAARAVGCRAEISLDFLAGYASFVPPRPLRRWERAGISAAGPAVQISAGLVVFFLVGGDVGWPLEGTTALQYAALWSGPVIGLFNLLPVLPFDGGSILQTFIDWFTPRHSRTIMYVFTVVVALGGIVYMASRPDLRSLIIFAFIPLMTVAQMIRSDRDHGRAVDRRSALQDAEAMAWATGRVDQFSRITVDALTPTTVLPSPWFRAAQQRRAGHPDVARDILVGDLLDRRPDADVWWPPEVAPIDELGTLVDLLPTPLPVGRPWATAALCEILFRLGRHHDAGTLAAGAYAAARSGTMALTVARAAARLDDRATAVAWLRTAAAHLSGFELDAAIAAAPELRTLAADPAVAALLD